MYTERRQHPLSPDRRFSDPEHAFTINENPTRPQFADLKEISGVYVLMTHKHMVLYVGQSVQLGKRICHHLSSNIIPFQSLAYRACDELSENEMALLWEYLPPHNGAYEPNTTFIPLNQFAEEVVGCLMNTPLPNYVSKELLGVEIGDKVAIYRVLHQAGLTIRKHRGAYCDRQLIKYDEAREWLSVLRTKTQGYEKRGDVELTETYRVNLPCSVATIDAHCNGEFAPLIEYHLSDTEVIIAYQNYKPLITMLQEARYAFSPASHETDMLKALYGKHA